MSKMVYILLAWHMVDGTLYFWHVFALCAISTHILHLHPCIASGNQSWSGSAWLRVVFLCVTFCTVFFIFSALYFAQFCAILRVQFCRVYFVCIIFCTFLCNIVCAFLQSIFSVHYNLHYFVQCVQFLYFVCIIFCTVLCNVCSFYILCDLYFALFVHWYCSGLIQGDPACAYWCSIVQSNILPIVMSRSQKNHKIMMKKCNIA